MTDEPDEPIRRKRILNPGAPPTLPPHESRRAKQRRLKRPPGRPRNPVRENAFVPNAEQKQLVRLLAGFGIPPVRICKVIKNEHTHRPIGVPTLERCFADELECGSVEMDSIACGMLAAKVRQGNLTAIIWYMKNRMGWHDHVVQERIGNGTEVDVNIKIDPNELARELERRHLPGEIFGVDKPEPLDVTPKRLEPVDAGPYDALSDAPDDPDAESDDARRERQYLEARMQGHIKRWSN
jgi:hypothetical protein